MQWLKFERLRWEKGRPETAEYHCEGCDAAIAEHHKTAMLEAGEWRATAEAADPGTVGYHLSALYSPVGWLGWDRIARAWEAARGSDEAIKAFRNTILGETWVETGEAPDWQRLADRREAWKPGTVPDRGLFLTAGADVQKDRIEVDVWAWGRGLESWLVDHLVIEGGPGDPACWQQLTDLLGRTWRHASGEHLAIARFAIDTGFETSAVYGWARQVGFAQVAPGQGARRVQPGKPGDGADLCRCDGRRASACAAARVCGPWPPRPSRPRPIASCGRSGRPTKRSWPVHRFRRERCICRLGGQRMAAAADRRAVGHGAGKRGFAKLEWQKLRERNEALDCRVYARAAAWIAGADRWSEARWQDLERQLAVQTPRRTARRRPSPRPARHRGGRRGDRVTWGEAQPVRVR